MGFRDIRKFNKALLAKQLWRMVTNPDSLVARVFGARYGNHGDLMSAQLKSNASFIWRLLVWSRDVVKRGMVWPMGDGADISVYNDSWVAGVVGCLRSVGVCGGEEGAKVNALISSPGRWDEDEVRRLFHPLVQSAILRTPIGETGVRDERFWSFDEKGRFSVKSTYLVEIGFYGSHAHVSEPDRKSWAKLVWNVSIPPKARVFLWRAMNNIIPMATNPREYHVPTSGICLLCKDRWDSSEHALMFCPRVVRIWKQSRFWEVLRKASGLPLFDVALAARGEMGKDDYELWAITLWQIWSMVCKLKHLPRDATELVSDSSCIAVWEAYLTARPTVALADRLGLDWGIKSGGDRAVVDCG